MIGERKMRRSVCWLLLIAAFVVLVAVQRAIDRAPNRARSSETLDFRSGQTLRQASMGLDGLLAEIYWMRTVQYFGRQRLAHSTDFHLLAPLLEITTELDPHLLLAYRFGAIYLAQKPPDGAGQPQKALQVLRRGIVANPDYWRFWQDVGFIELWELHDRQAAQRAFETGSKRPGALPWMRAMAEKLKSSYK